MPKVILTGSIRQHAGGLASAEVEGETVWAAIAALERLSPALRGWVIDERGALRRHVRIFHRGAAVSLDAPLAPHDELHVIGAISGG
jgi:molybdopterin converting factor small subunit